MRMAVKTSPITAAPPFSVHLTGERERAGGFTLSVLAGETASVLAGETASVLAGETALGRTGFARWYASEYTVLPFNRLVRF